jgi:hypothetical protein
MPNTSVQLLENRCYPSSMMSSLESFPQRQNIQASIKRKSPTLNHSLRKNELRYVGWEVSSPELTQI